jgi:WhiB family redox-sensing transcriptional regulator
MSGRTTSPPTQTWMRDGLCAASPTPDLWFPEPGQPDAARKAKAICRACPVKAQCLAHAMAMGILHGIWGGTAPEERDGRKARRGQQQMDSATRSRKTEAERDRRRRLRGAAAAGDPKAAERLERERRRKRAAESLAAARQRTRRARAAS